MRRNIVLVDRDTIRRAQLSEALTKTGFDVAEFEAAKDALKHLLFSTVSAVIVDYGSAYELQNPVPDGKRIVREIVGVDAFVPLVVICDRCEILDHETVTAADLVLRRPLTDRQLSDGIHTVLGETLRERAQRKSGYIFAFR
jgi:DNA-binding response OmpR family regulator